MIALVPLVLLSIAAPLGAIDVLYYHLYKFRLHARAESHTETMTHLLRGFLIAAVVFVLVLYETRGAWYWVIVGAFAIDFLNNLLDVALEPNSRASLGGLPPREYILHIVGATFSGIVGASFVILAHPLAGQTTALVPARLPLWLVVDGLAVAIGALLLTGIEGGLLVRSLLAAREPRAVLRGQAS